MFYKSHRVFFQNYHADLKDLIYFFDSCLDGDFNNKLSPESENLKSKLLNNNGESIVENNHLDTDVHEINDSLYQVEL